jgi:hypothetical protein
MRMAVGRLTGAERAMLPEEVTRRRYVRVFASRLDVNGMSLSAEDALKIARPAHLQFSKGRDAEVLVLDLRG